MAKFEKTYCSQCGGEFGPGDEGFSHCDQHTDRTDTDEADLDEEEFLALTDGQQDAMLAREMKRYSDALDKMTPQNLYRYRRRRTLDLIRKQRRLAEEFSGVDVFKEHLRASQRRLLAWRIEYRTGATVGNA